MSRLTVTELTCDRCGLKDSPPPDAWGVLARTPPLTPRRDPVFPEDLCPDCYRALSRWWSQGKTGEGLRDLPPAA